MRVAGNDKAVTNISCPLVVVASAVEKGQKKQYNFIYKNQ
jgi:hypothetical protein